MSVTSSSRMGPISQGFVSAPNKYVPVFFLFFFFATSANVACLYKPKCYQWPQSASVMCLLSGLAAAVKCQLKCQEGSRQRLGRRNGQMPMAGQVGADVTLSPEPQEVCF